VIVRNVCFVGGSLRPIDVQLMKHLQAQVNIVPVIAKADTLTSTEVKRLKTQVSLARRVLKFLENFIVLCG